MTPAAHSRQAPVSAAFSGFCLSSLTPEGSEPAGAVPSCKPTGQYFQSPSSRPLRQAAATGTTTAPSSASGDGGHEIPGRRPTTPWSRGATGEGALTRGLREHLSRPPQPMTTAPQLNPMASRLRRAGPPGPSTAAGAAAALLTPARGYRQRQARRTPRVEPATGRKNITMHQDFLMAAVKQGRRKPE